MQDLRHTFVSVVVSKGMSLAHVQKLLPRKSSTLTSCYAHMADVALSWVAKGLANFLEIVPVK